MLYTNPPVQGVMVRTKPKEEAPCSNLRLAHCIRLPGCHRRHCFCVVVVLQSSSLPKQVVTGGQKDGSGEGKHRRRPDQFSKHITTARRNWLVGITPTTGPSIIIIFEYHRLDAKSNAPKVLITSPSNIIFQSQRPVRYLIFFEEFTPGVTLAPTQGRRPER